MTKARDLASGAPAPAGVTTTELGFVDGVTSAIQTQVDAKLASSTAATTYVANALADAKGDIFVASADNTVTRLPVGSTGDTIVADSSTATGLRYQVPVNANPVLNSAFQVWQRGTSIAGSAGSYLYTADRWQTDASTSITVSRQATGDTTNLPFIQYCARGQRNSGSTATAGVILSQSFESINSIQYAGKTVTFSFYARRGANFSGASNQILANLVTGTGTDQNAFVGGFTGGVNLISATPALTTTWQRFTYTATVGSTVTQLALQFLYTPTGTAGAADYYEVTGVQVEVGSVATPFKTYAGTIQGELAACQRYYYRITAGDEQPISNQGYFFSSTAFGSMIPFKVQMRTTPTVLDFSQIAVSNYNGFYSEATGASIVKASAYQAIVNATGLTGGSTGSAYGTLVAFNAGRTGYVGLSAEL